MQRDLIIQLSVAIILAVGLILYDKIPPIHGATLIFVFVILISAFRILREKWQQIKEEKVIDEFRRSRLENKN